MLNFTCDLKQVKKNAIRFSVEILLKPNITVSLLEVGLLRLLQHFMSEGIPNIICKQKHRFQLKISVLRQEATGLKPVLGIKNLIVDACRYLSGTFGSVFMDMVLPNLLKCSNVRGCPFTVRPHSTYSTYSRYSTKIIINLNANCVSYYFQNRIWLKECEIDYKFPPIMPAGNITINFGFFWVVKQGKKIINRNIGDVKVYVIIKNRSYNVQ